MMMIDETWNEWTWESRRAKSCGTKHGSFVRIKHVVYDFVNSLLFNFKERVEVSKKWYKLLILFLNL